MTLTRLVVGRHFKKMLSCFEPLHKFLKAPNFTIDDCPHSRPPIKPGSPPIGKLLRRSPQPGPRVLPG